MTIEIYDNYLEKETLLLLQENLTQPDFPWYYNKGKVGRNSLYGSDIIYDYQFVHTFFRDGMQSSNMCSRIKPLIDKLDPFCIKRIKANMTLITPEPIVYGMHRDFFAKKSLKTAIFYVNTNNGPTLFETNDEIKHVNAVENRLVVFDSNIRHTGVSSSDTRYRIVLNINYYAQN